MTDPGQGSTRSCEVSFTSRGVVANLDLVKMQVGSEAGAVQESVDIAISAAQQAAGAARCADPQALSDPGSPGCPGAGHQETGSMTGIPLSRRMRRCKGRSEYEKDGV